MQVTHYLGILSISRNVNQNLGFLLTNKKGSYCSFFSAPSSRYHGLFYFDHKSMEMYKFIENIEIEGHGKIDSIKNGFYFAERKKNEATESFLMPKEFNSLIYELDSERSINLVLDCKASYDNREWGRCYGISEEEGCIVVKFTKKTDKREDESNGVEEFSLYLAIRSSNRFYEKNDKWIEGHYVDDEERKSMPFKRHVYNALRLKGSKFVFSMSKNRNSAVKECGHVFDNISELKNKEKECFFDLLKKEHVKKTISDGKLGNEIKIAYINSLNSLNNLIVNGRKNCCIFAGLPWFFQSWARDTLVSLKALQEIDKEFSEEILFSYLNKINNDGRLPNPAVHNISKDLGNADTHGWLFLRCDELVEKINKNKEIVNSIKKSIKLIKEGRNADPTRIKEYMKKCNSIINKKENEYHKIIYEIESSLEKSISGLLKFHTKDNFEFNEAKETWMDTDFGDDGRKGIRIEIQALRLNIYKLMFELTQNNKYKILENILKNKTRQKFWNGKVLADGLNDFTIRPNIFIAAYAYPELLAQKEWEICFDNVLKSLWLGWGGLSTIDKGNKLFADAYSGEDSKSYHRGDSWFWINNLAALVLHKLNNKKFQKYIKKIIEASTEEILWKGCIGCHSELSDAKELKSQGCFNQAWSDAMYIELVDEVFE